MKYHKQTILHDPANGKWGDCFRTCLACLLDLDPHEVPHFMHGGDLDMGEVWASVDEWLSERGLQRAVFAFQADVDEVLQTMGHMNPTVAYMLMGESPRGTNHEVVARGGEIVNDPHPEGGGLVGPADNGFVYVEMLVSRIGVERAA